MLPSPRRPLCYASLLVFAYAALLLRTAWGQGLPAGGETAYGLLWLDIDSEQAEIALDGLYLDQGVWLISIPPGAHEIRVRKPGFKDYESRFGILSGQNLHLDVHLQPAGDSLMRLPG